MKRHVKLFEQFLTEEDPLAALTGGGEGKAKEDPLEKKKKETMAKEKAAAKKHEKMMDKKEESAEDILNKLPEIKEKYGEAILKAIKDQDRVQIHNSVNDLIYAQQDYQERGDQEMVDKITRLKEMLDKLDKSFTSDKRM
jgi:hypothetical protein